MKNIYIVTGASRGIGEAIAKELVHADNHLICCSRTKNDSLVNLAADNNCRMDYYELDLSDTSLVINYFTDIFKELEWNKAENVVLINNAGLLEPVARTEDSDPHLISRHITVNLSSLMIISSLFINAGKQFNTGKEIINISSGAAYNPYPGWGSYCASKAGALMFAKVLAVEQKDAENPVKVVSVAPGVVETSMQETIRSKTTRDFPNIDKFIKLKQENKLFEPAFVAKKVAGSILHNDKIKQGAEIDIREY